MATNGDPLLADVKAAINKWLALKDDSFVDILLACAIGERVQGEPLWLFVIAPPGSSKTEVVRPLDDKKWFFPLSNLTPQSLVSGYYTENKEGKKEKKQDILPQLHRKIVVFKDFTVVLEKNKDARNQIMGQLRDMYDGSYTAVFGTLEKPVSYAARFGIIACVTPVIDKHWKVLQQLGERFLKLRIEHDRLKATRRARENEGREFLMRKEIKEIVNNFLHALEISDVLIPEEFEERLEYLADFVSRGRTPVPLQTNRKAFDFHYIPEPELPTRLVKQFKKLLRCLAIIHQKTKSTYQEWQLIKKVGLDTLPQDRRVVIVSIQKSKESFNHKEIAADTNIPEATVWNILLQLQQLGLVDWDMHSHLNPGTKEKIWKLAEVTRKALTDL